MTAILNIEDARTIRSKSAASGEIESTLAQDPLVEQNVVMAREDDPGDLRLVAYIVPKDKKYTENDASMSALVQELVRRLDERLPEFMVPSVLVVLAAMPLTPNGKVNRLALPKPESGGLRTAKEFVEPQSEMEKTIAAAWRDVLHLEKVGVDDNFFDVGGHSLLLVRVHSRLRSEMSHPLTVTNLFRYPTIRALARFLSEGQAAEQKGLSAAQERAARQIEALQRRKPAAPKPGPRRPN